jgi:hypothetical protein
MCRGWVHQTKSKPLKPLTEPHIDVTFPSRHTLSTQLIPIKKKMQIIDGGPYSEGISAAPGEHGYAGKTQGTIQQALQNFYTNNVHPIDWLFFGCLYPCNSALHCIDL